MKLPVFTIHLLAKGILLTEDLGRDLILWGERCGIPCLGHEVGGLFSVLKCWYISERAQMIYAISACFRTGLQMVGLLVSICSSQREERFFKVCRMKQFSLSSFLGHSSLNSVSKISLFFPNGLLENIKAHQWPRISETCSAAVYIYIYKVKDHIFIFKKLNCFSFWVVLGLELAHFSFLNVKYMNY